MKKYRELHRRVQYRLDTSSLNLDFLSATIDEEIDDPEYVSSLEAPRSTPPLQINATNWPSADEIDVCNSDLVMAITEVITRNMIATKNHLISLKDLFGLNPKQLDMKLWEKRCRTSPPCPRQMHRRGRRAALGALGAAVVAMEELRQAASWWQRLHQGNRKVL
jgi:hypothetical protein